MKSLMKTVKSYLYMLSLLKKSYPQRLLLLPVYVIFRALLPFVPVIFSAMIIDGLVDGQSFQKIISLIVAMCISGFVMEYIIELIDEHDVVWEACFAFEVTGIILKKYMELDMADMETPEVYEKYNLANVALEKGIGYFLDSVKDILIKIIELVVASVIIASLHPLLILILVCITVLSSFLQKESLKTDREFDEVMVAEDRKYRYLYDTINDFQYGKEIRVYSLREKLLERLNILNDRYLVAFRKAKRKVNFLQGIYHLISLVINTSVYIYMIFSFLILKITIGNFTIILGTIERFKNALTAISECLVKTNDMGIRIQDMQDFLGLESKLEATAKADSGRLSDYDIRFVDVGFHYPHTEQMVLKGINITISHGEKLTIVGENGAGKSTFVKLLFRLYDPTEGAIYLGGRDIRDFPLEEYHRILASVFQDYRMMSFTLRDNIVFGSEPCEDDGKIYEILKMLQMEEKVRKLPKGLDTYLNHDYEEEGVLMSGGELQKLAIARAIYRNASIFVVDEPTSALDAIAEAEIYSLFRRIVGENTCIFISHRMSSARLGGKIALFDGGRITEYGTFEEVMRLKGRFYELYRLQAQYYVEDGVKR